MNLNNFKQIIYEQVYTHKKILLIVFQQSLQVILKMPTIDWVKFETVAIFATVVEKTSGIS